MFDKDKTKYVRIVDESYVWLWSYDDTVVIVGNSSGNFTHW